MADQNLDGEVLIEKILRSCNVKTIYTLVRSKKGKSSSFRMNELFECEMFACLKGDWRSKLKPVEGEMGFPDLAISNAMKQELFNNVDIVIHCAATIRFDESLRQAILINVQGTGEVLSLCKRMTILKSVVHVSTAFSHCINTSIDEKFYTSALNYKKALILPDIHDEDALNSLESTIVNGWPNTYTFTKSISEELVRTEGKDLPIAIFRPALVVSTSIDCSVPGYIDNAYGPVGFVVGIGFGVLRSLHLSDVPAPIVPADYCINAILAVARSASIQQSEEIPIYNFSAHPDNPMSYADMMRCGMTYGHTVPSIRCLWYNSVSITKSKWIHLFARFFLHVLPAFFIDIVLKLMGHKTKAMYMCQKAHTLLDKVAFFGCTYWHFGCENTRNLYNSLNTIDKKIFYFDMQKLDWIEFCSVIVDGVRLFLFKEKLDTLDAARKRYFKFKILHKTIIYVLYAVTIYWIFRALQQYCFPIMQTDFKHIDIL